MIISLGEALIDFIYSEEQGKPVFKPVPGGSPYNTAVALTRLEVHTAFASKLSRDMFGNMLLENLIENKVDTSAVLRSDNPSTLAFARIKEGKAEYAFYTNGSSDRSITVQEINQGVSVLKQQPVCIQIGSFSLALEPCSSAILEYIQQNKENSCISIDPNIRPSLVSDKQSYIQRLYTLFGLADIVKISDEDIAWIFSPPISNDIQKAAETILSYGASTCVVTEGIKGSHWFSKGTKAFAPTHPVTVTDTIGAGDTFHAGLLAYLFREGLLDKKQIPHIDTSKAERALAFATHAAECTCQREGADPPALQEVLRLMD